MELQLYNSLTASKEIFKPLQAKNVGMYVCGPTVYSNVHLGNVRTFMSFDLIFRTLTYFGYKVRYVRNITDAGHLTDDGNIENDRFVKQSKLEKLEPMEIVQKYTLDFHRVLDLFNLLPPTIEPTATGHIIEQIQLIEKLLEKGFAYVSEGSVYFDVLEYNKRGLNYGELSRRNIEELFANTRNLDGQGEKKNPQDFALWKKASPSHIMRWASPWGDGFPGWHLECTAMSTKYLGHQFDIHGGGMDLKFPHHECEIAQAKACNSHTPVRYWLHANMLTMNGQRMSKSTGNYILPMQLLNGENDFFEKPFSASVVRFCFMQAHYRSVLDISNEAMIAAEKGFRRLMDAVKIINEFKTDNQNDSSNFNITQWKEKCDKALADDFNSPILISLLFEATKWIFEIKGEKSKISQKQLDELKLSFNNFIFNILGLKNEQKDSIENNKLNSVIQLLIQMREQARADKNWNLSDLIRNQLKDLGIQLKDSKEGTTYTID